MSTTHYSDCIDGVVFDTRRASLLARGVRRVECRPSPGHVQPKTSLGVVHLCRDYRSHYFLWAYCAEPGSLSLVNVIQPISAEEALALYRSSGWQAVGYERAFLWSWPRRWAADRYDAIRPSLTLGNASRVRKLVGGGIISLGIAGWVTWISKVVPVVHHWFR